MKVKWEDHQVVAAAPATRDPDPTRGRVPRGLREVGPDVHVGQFAALHMRKMAKRVEKRRARWTAYGV